MDAAKKKGKAKAKKVKLGERAGENLREVSPTKGESTEVDRHEFSTLVSEHMQLQEGHDNLARTVREMDNTLSTFTSAVVLATKAVEELGAKIEALEKEVGELKSHGFKGRGPRSTREMTEDDAKRVISGDLKDVSVRKAAETLGLSYGQVYSARGGYTFKGLQP